MAVPRTGVGFGATGESGWSGVIVASSESVGEESGESFDSGSAVVSTFMRCGAFPSLVPAVGCDDGTVVDEGRVVEVEREVF